MSNVPVIPSDVGLNANYNAIQTAMAGIPWIEESYSRAYRVKELRDNQAYYIPKVYNSKREYISLEPDDEVTGFSFIDVVGDEEFSSYNQGLDSYIVQQEVELIVFANIEQINNQEDYIFGQELQADVIKALTFGPCQGKIENINRIVSGLEDVWNRYTYSQFDPKFYVENFVTFKVNMTLYSNYRCLRTYENDFIVNPCGDYTVQGNIYRNIASGNYGDLSIWEIYDGNAWVPATRIPNGTDDINIIGDNQITILENQTYYANNITLFPLLNGVGGFMFVIIGSLYYSGARNIASGDPLNPQPPSGLGSSPLIYDDSTGSLIRYGLSGDADSATLTAGSRRLLGKYTDQYKVASGSILNFNAGTSRHGDRVVFERGIYDFNQATQPDQDLSSGEYPNGEFGVIEVVNGATLKAPQEISGRQAGSNIFALSNFVLDDTSKIVYNKPFTAANPYLTTNAYELRGIVEYSLNGNQGLIRNSPLQGGSVGVDIDTYYNLVLDVSGVKSLFYDTTIIQSLTIGGTATLGLNGNTIEYDTEAFIKYLGSSNIIGDELPDSGSGVSICKNIECEDNSTLDLGGKTVNIRGVLIGEGITIINGTLNENQ